MGDGFIMKYVCCTNCRLPEISMAVKKGIIMGRCLACGWAGDLDNNHRLAAFISKNPPDESGHGLQVQDVSGGKQDKKARREAKAAKKAAGHDEDEDDDDDDESYKSSEKEKKAKKDKKEKKEKKEKKGEKKK